MAENKNAKKAAAAAATAPVETSTPAEHARKEQKKSRWTPDTCMNAAKRFTNRDDWASGHPSSYKAACAKGWDTQCSAHMTKAPAMKVAAKAKTKVAAAPAEKPRKAG